MQRSLIGFGEAGQAFAAGWQDEGLAPPKVFDCRDLPPAHDVRLGARAEVLRDAGAVFCLVTADRALQAATECAPFLAPDALWFDGNSCAPETKRRAAEIIHAAGGRYVDMAIMAPVHPRRHRTPLLIAGPHAETALAALQGLGMSARIAGAAVGQASSIKMIRSVMIKGLEALHTECFLAARRAGVEAEVITSLTASNPEVDWPAKTAYDLERMMRHGLRRAAEMREVAVTLQDLGVPNGLTRAAAEWQDRIGRMGLAEAEGDLWTRLDLVVRGL